MSQGVVVKLYYDEKDLFTYNFPLLLYIFFFNLFMVIYNLK